MEKITKFMIFTLISINTAFSASKIEMNDCYSESCLLRNTHGNILKLEYVKIEPQGVTQFLNKHTEITRVEFNDLECSTNFLNFDDCASAISSTGQIKEMILISTEVTNRGIFQLAENTNLELLELKSNWRVGFITAVDSTTAKALAQLPKLKQLIIQGNSKIDEHAIVALAKSKSLKKLVIDGDGFQKSVITKTGAQALAQNKSITQLDLIDLYVWDEEAKELAKSNTLTELNLYHNSIKDVGASALATNMHLKSLNVEHNGITSVGAINLSKNSSLTSLKIGGNEIGDEGAIALANNSVITELSLHYYCNIFEEHLTNIGLLPLVSNPRLKSLDISGIWLTNEAADALGNNQSITSFKAQCSNISEDILITSITKNKNLQELDFSENHISLNSVLELLSLPNLRSLDLSQNYSHLYEADLVAAALAKSTQINYLKYQDNHMGSDGAIALAQNTTIKSLNIAKNEIAPEGVLAFGNNRALKWLNISQNWDKRGYTACLTLSQNSVIETILCDG